MGCVLQELETIFGEAKPEWEGGSSSINGAPKLNPFLYRVYAPDPSHLTLHVSDFRDNTWESRRSILQLEDMRDSIGISGSWSDFVNYVVASLKSKDVKLVMKWQPNLNGVDYKSRTDNHQLLAMYFGPNFSHILSSTTGVKVNVPNPSEWREFEFTMLCDLRCSYAVSAKLVARKSKGMPLLSISLSKLNHSAASEAMANMSLELFKAYNVLKDPFGTEQDRCCRLTHTTSVEKDKNPAVKRKLDTATNMEKQAFQKTSDIGSTASPLNSETSSVTEKQAATEVESKVPHRVVPAFRRAKVRGAVLHDSDEEGG